jgi:predicted ATPase
LWYLGYPDQAIQQSQQSMTLANEVSHPSSLAQALFWTTAVHQHCREVSTVQEFAAVLTTLATEQVLGFRLAEGMVLHGWALVMQGQGDTGIAEIRQGIAAALATGDNTFKHYFMGLLADAYGKAGQTEAGLSTLAEALVLMDTTEACFYAAEIHRLEGELLLQQSLDNATEAEACFHQAISRAQNQSAKSWELRAATSLARLWQSQGKRGEARELLAPVYGWFTEGFDTADLIEAKELLDELST